MSPPPLPCLRSAAAPNPVSCLLVAVLAFAAAGGAETVEVARPAMGSPFEVKAVHPDRTVAEEAVTAAFAEIDRIEARISSWRETSETSALNRHAGKGPFAVSEELFELIRRALKVGELTDGAFDITFGAAGRLWDFKAANPRLPDPDELAAALADVDYRAVELDPAAHTVNIPRPGMRLGFGGIGKGYAANRAVQVMRDRGVTGGVVNAGGDLVAFGHDDAGEPWRIAIADPLHPGRVFAYLELTDQAVVTSGDYERFIEIEGVRYAHILDPRTGYPVRGVRSVTVICPDGELADALATSVFVLGPERGLALVDRLRGVEALLVDEAGRLHFSANLRSQLIREGVNKPLRGEN